MTTSDDYKALHSLTDRQLAAIDVILAGGDRQSAATAAGVHRVTVSKWANKHPEFKAELNRGRAERTQFNGDRIRRMDELALGWLMKRIESGDDAAIRDWIRMRQLGKIDTSVVGPTNADLFIGQDVQDRYAEVEQDFSDVAAESTSMGQLHTPDRALIRATIEQELVQDLRAADDEAESVDDH